VGQFDLASKLGDCPYLRYGDEDGNPDQQARSDDQERYDDRDRRSCVSNSPTAGHTVSVVLSTAGVSGTVATAVACATALGLASVAPWRLDKRLSGLSVGYVFAFILLAAPIWIVLLLMLNPSSGD
jgi:hypothetical protein